MPGKPEKQYINQVIVSGEVHNQVQIYSGGRYVFTLRNSDGWFYVLWPKPDWILQQGQQVLVRGEIFSVLAEKGNLTRIRAAEVILLAERTE